MKFSKKTALTFLSIVLMFMILMPVTSSANAVPGTLSGQWIHPDQYWGNTADLPLETGNGDIFYHYYCGNPSYYFVSIFDQFNSRIFLNEKVYLTPTENGCGLVEIPIQNLPINEILKIRFIFVNQYTLEQYTPPFKYFRLH